MKKKKVKIKDRRYESVMRMLDLDIVKPYRKKKLLIIQIDSLAHEIMKRFLDKGSCKFLNSLINKRGYHLHRYNCGLPSGTPAVQAGIMYGDNSMIPGFRFVEKDNKRQVSFGNPNHVKYMEERHFIKKKGILEGGSSYSNHFSGGAKRSILTMSTMTKSKHLRRIKESNLWLFLFLHPGSLFRVLYYTTTELLLELLEIITYPITKLFSKRTAIFGFRIPIRRFLMNVVLAELITIGVILDIKRKMPKIYLNLMGFDEIAHLRGPNSLTSYFMVRSLDRRIKRICKHVNEDEYDVFIMSDHGQVDSVPFRMAEGMELADFIQKCAHVESFGLTSAHEGRLSMLGIAMGKTIGFLKYVSTPLRWIGTKFARGMIRMLKPKRYRFLWDAQEAIFVLDSCALANVYFNISKRRMEKKAIDKKYPKLIDKLVQNRSIGVVMVKRGKDILLLNRKGKMTIKPDSIKKEGSDFLKRFGEEDVLIKQIRELDSMADIGDLVLFGNYRDGKAISFTEHAGAHGGMGGNMCYPFMISKKRYNLSKVSDARQLNRIFREY